MMNARWKVLNLTYQMSEDEQRQVEACSRCFAQLILQNRTHLESQKHI